MKKIISLSVAMIILSAAASHSAPYYIGFVNTAEKSALIWNPETGVYSANPDVIEGSYLIYASDGSASYGSRIPDEGATMPECSILLKKDGAPIYVDGGGKLYGCTVEFNPVDLTLEVSGGSRLPVDPYILVELADIKVRSANSADISLVVSDFNLPLDLPRQYSVSVNYTDLNGRVTCRSLEMNGMPTADLTIVGLPSDSSTPVNISAEALIGENCYYSEARIRITTPPSLSGSVPSPDWANDFREHQTLWPWCISEPE